ncbi:MAG TPA: four-helix bundle copper-binding protein [Streptosporangiaceae bacterium]|nr:four-helix bundle copper-binding protein [Streptosporangiaceae bacterium]
MSYARQMVDAYPGTIGIEASLLAGTIEALTDCAQACTADTDDDLSEPNVAEMVACIRLCLDCADVCTATAGVASRQREELNPEVMKPLLEACAAICRSCADECERHAHMHRHCRVCAEACRRGEQASRELLAAIR